MYKPQKLVLLMSFLFATGIILPSLAMATTNGKPFHLAVKKTESIHTYQRVVRPAPKTAGTIVRVPLPRAAVGNLPTRPLPTSPKGSPVIPSGTTSSSVPPIGTGSLGVDLNTGNQTGAQVVPPLMRSPATTNPDITRGRLPQSSAPDITRGR